MLKSCRFFSYCDAGLFNLKSVSYKTIHKVGIKVGIYIYTRASCNANLMHNKSTFMLIVVHLQNIWVNIFPLDEVLPLLLTNTLTCGVFLLFVVGSSRLLTEPEKSSQICLWYSKTSVKAKCCICYKYYEEIFPKISFSYSPLCSKNVNHLLNSK